MIGDDVYRRMPTKIELTLKQYIKVLVLSLGRIEGVDEYKKVWILGENQSSHQLQLRQKRVITYLSKSMLIVDIVDDIMDPVMQCTTLPSHSGFSQKKLVSFVTEIHTLSIDISLRYYPTLEREPCQGDSLNLTDQGLDDGVAAYSSEGWIHKPHVILKLSKSNRLTSSLLINFPSQRASK
ncbi:hypothetical protein Tco_0861690 [Tanacetum coccineum]|uniref:Uncharacterized protein n=1 Tax=Tanacetum coccineum TaxID=301880 RepID=A0ABQ5BJD5_9ASTR